ncbi:MAG: DUF3108 domain-containing protein [Proteobacteria bacterium]|nr:DUF3108 domain-containing protein [Pseudomonadota bacterium]
MEIISKFFLLLFMLTLLPSNVSALPFNVGERLEFNLTWSGIKAGTTVMEISGISDVGGREALHMVSRSNPSKIVSALYDVNNWTDFYVDAKTLAPLKYEVVQQKKGRKKNKSAIFDLERNEVEFTKGGNKKVVKVSDGIIDPFSLIYYLRTLDLKPEVEIELDTFANGKIYITVVKVVGREKIRVGGGSFETIKVHTRSRDKGSEELRGKEGTYIWFTDDQYKIPVKIMAKIKVGYITAELDKVEGGGGSKR